VTLLRASVRVLDRHDLAEVQRLCAVDRIANLFVASRVQTLQAEPGRVSGELWGWYDSGGLRSACWAGANLVPVEAGAEAVEAFAAKARRRGRQCSSIVGEAGAVLRMWRALEPHWGPARDVRPDQPLLALAGQPLVPADPQVRQTRPEDLDLVLPACVAMFTEEVGYSPIGADGGALYRSQVAGLVAAGRSYSRLGDSRSGREVVFKAELGSVTAHGAQVQGVWVHPRHRGRGLAAPGMAAVVAQVQRTAPVVSLYVNSYNERAIRAYHRVGFNRVGTFATVLF
jgi:predicted GNAT family acetyltransferase